MKKIFLAIALVIVCGCESKTSFGSCIGLVDDKDPKFDYKLSVLNMALGIIFVEMIVPPIIVAADETFCPTAFKKEAK